MEVVENGEFDWQSEEKKAREWISQVLSIFLILLFNLSSLKCKFLIEQYIVEL